MIQSLEVFNCISSFQDLAKNLFLRPKSRIRHEPSVACLAQNSTTVIMLSVTRGNVQKEKEAKKYLLTSGGFVTLAKQ